MSNMGMTAHPGTQTAGGVPARCIRRVPCRPRRHGPRRRVLLRGRRGPTSEHPAPTVAGPSAPSGVQGAGFGVVAATAGPRSGRHAGTRPRPRPGPAIAAAEPGSLEPDLVLLGSWTVEYAAGPENGNGANIEIPLRRLDGLVIKPGATFDFWRAVGEVSRRTGYRRGGVIVGDHVDPDGALAGGICTVSTALFDAAAQAGLQIVRRTSHGGYLAKYRLGLDAAVAKGDGSTRPWRSATTPPSRSWSAPSARRGSPGSTCTRAALGRRVTFSQPAISHRQHAVDRHVRVGLAAARPAPAGRGRGATA